MCITQEEINEVNNFIKERLAEGNGVFLPRVLNLMNTRLGTNLEISGGS